MKTIVFPDGRPRRIVQKCFGFFLRKDVMDDLIAMKGRGQRTRSVRIGVGIIDLLRYVDGSWGIARNGNTLAVWEPAEKETCFIAFSLFIPAAGLGQPENLE